MGLTSLQCLGAGDRLGGLPALLPVAVSPDQMEADGLLFASCSNPTPVTQRQFIATLWSVS